MPFYRWENRGTKVLPRGVGELDVTTGGLALDPAPLFLHCIERLGEELLLPGEGQREVLGGGGMQAGVW